MLQKTLILSLYIIGTLAAPADRPGRVCGNHLATAQAAGSGSRIASNPTRQPSNITGEQVFQNVTIPVYWHVLSSGTSPSQGNVIEKQITDSIDVMNERYGTTGFSFQLVNTTRTRNPTWFNNLYDGSSVERVVKKTLRQGGANALNIYTASFKNVPTDFQGLLGYATLASWYQDDPELDGVVIQYQTLPGGTLEPFDLGLTLVHESGHWFELFHTFNEGDFANSCRGPGDLVADTPMQRSDTKGCPANRDSCPNQPGKDPIHNYMDYSDDACMSEFTPGQISRMQEFYARYRAVQPI